MPSFLQISTSRSIHETKAPIAHTVISCQRPPCMSGAMPRPYDRSGGAMEICQRFQVGPCEAPQTISSVPIEAKNTVVTPKKPTKNGPTQKSNRSPPISVPPRTRYFLSKLSKAMMRFPASSLANGRVQPVVSRTRRARRPDESLPSLFLSSKGELLARRRHRRRHRRRRTGDRARLVRTVQPVEAIGAEQDEM